MDEACVLINTLKAVHKTTSQHSTKNKVFKAFATVLPTCFQSYVTAAVSSGLQLTLLKFSPLDLLESATTTQVFSSSV